MVNLWQCLPPIVTNHCKQPGKGWAKWYSTEQQSKKKYHQPTPTSNEDTYILARLQEEVNIRFYFQDKICNHLLLDSFNHCSPCAITMTTCLLLINTADWSTVCTMFLHIQVLLFLVAYRGNVVLKLPTMSLTRLPQLNPCLPWRFSAG